MAKTTFSGPVQSLNGFIGGATTRFHTVVLLLLLISQEELLKSTMLMEK
jgi:hypothetical protein